MEQVIAEPICVCVRIRSLTSPEVAAGHMNVWQHDDVRVWQTHPAPNSRLRTSIHHLYGFDRVYGEHDSTELIHSERVSVLCERMLQGYNVSLMTYGQTSSGKTTTIRGSPFGRLRDGDDDGLIALSVRQLLSGMVANGGPTRWTLRLAYLEIYNEQVIDLLTGRAGLGMYDRKDGSVRVAELAEEEVCCWEEAEALLRRGDTVRHVGATSHNERSSRSHAVCRLSLTRHATASEPTAGVSELHVCDLAGSERVSAHARGRAGLDTKSRGVEGGHINKSLLVLANVIQRLAEDASRQHGSRGSSRSNGSHVPFRSSKITRLLQGSLSGDAASLILCCLSPAGAHAEESHHTLRFGARAKKVTVAPVRRVAVDPQRERLLAYEAEIASSRLELASSRAQIEQLRAQLLATSELRLQLSRGIAPDRLEGQLARGFAPEQVTSSPHLVSSRLISTHLVSSRLISPHLASHLDQSPTPSYNLSRIPLVT